MSYADDAIAFVLCLGAGCRRYQVGLLLEQAISTMPTKQGRSFFGQKFVGCRDLTAIGI